MSGLASKYRPTSDDEWRAKFKASPYSTIGFLQSSLRYAMEELRRAGHHSAAAEAARALKLSGDDE